jgi:hypothetical protein
MLALPLKLTPLIVRAVCNVVAVVALPAKVAVIVVAVVFNPNVALAAAASTSSINDLPKADKAVIPIAVVLVKYGKPLTDGVTLESAVRFTPEA